MSVSSIFYKSLLYFTFLSFLSSCKEEKPISEFDNSKKITYKMTDTASAEISTILMDSIPTSETSILLVGKYNKSDLGTIQTSSFFEFSLGAEDDVILEYDTEPVFDSLVLLMKHNYCYGDANTPFTIEIKKLTENMSKKNLSHIYSGMSFTFDPQIIANATFLPERISNSGDKLRLKLLDEIGLDLFNLALTNNFRISSSSHLKDYFKGFAICSGSSNTTLQGFVNSPILRLYYHDSENKETLYYDFVHDENDLHSNYILHQRNGTDYVNLSEIYSELNSSDAAALVCGVNLIPKIKFNYLQKIKKEHANMQVYNAQLIIRAKENSYSPDLWLPKRITLYTTDNTNRYGSLITSNSSQQIVNPVIDYEHPEKTYYTFDLTEFVKSQMELEEYNKECILISPLFAESGEKVESMILENSSNSSISLNIYYTETK